MTDLPPWFSVSVVGLGLAVGAALAGLWHGLWPYAGPHVFEPNLFGFAALCGAVAFVGVNDTFRALTRQPMDPGTALVEIIVGGGLAFALTQHLLPLVIAIVLLALLRSQAGYLTKHVVNLYDSGKPEVARRVRRIFTGAGLAAGMILVVFLLGSGLDTRAGLLHWTTAPIVLAGGVFALMLVSGTEYEVMRSRFRGGEVTADASFGTGWWGPAAGVIAAVVIVSALVPPPPSFITLRQVGNTVLAVGERSTNKGGPQNLTTTQSGKPKAGTNCPTGAAGSSGTAAAAGSTGTAAATGATGTAATNCAKPNPIASHAGLLIFLVLAAVFVGTLAYRLVTYSRRLGTDAYALGLQYLRGAIDMARSSVAFFLGLYELFAQGLRGDWSGMLRFLRRWWIWILDVISGRMWRNIWRQLGIRSAAHRAGAEFGAEAGARTMAGAAWSLPPGDPRRRVRELYRTFMQNARDAGLGRRPHQTPATFLRAIVAVEPGTDEGLHELTGAYEWARFSHHPVTADHISHASGGWERIAGFFARRREQQRSRPAGQTAAPAGKATVGKGVQVKPGAAGRRRRI